VPGHIPENTGEEEEDSEEEEFIETAEDSKITCVSVYIGHQ